MYRYIYLLPFVLMVVGFLSICFDLNFTLWGNIGGYSITTNMLFFYIFWYGKYCMFTKLSCIALFLTNIVNIYGVYFPENYEIWYELVIYSVFLICIIINELDKWINR